MHIVIHGLKTCETCRKAKKWLEEQGRPTRLRDLRAEPPSREEIEAWLETFGRDRLLNRRGTTWRSLSEAERAEAETDPAGLLARHPALVKRPVVTTDVGAVLGFDAQARSKLLDLLKI